MKFPRYSVSLPCLLVMIALSAGCSRAIKPTPATPGPQAGGYPARPDVKTFIAQTAESEKLDPAWITRALGEARHQDAIIAAITRPYEARPWYQYRPIFLTDARVTAGVQFWNAHAASLARAQQTYRVPVSMIVAIIGIESNYGRQHGGYRVLDALTTLGFDYPPRGGFFRRELAEFLLMCHERGLDPITPMGSYAGAMGAPQFMPDSYRQYAVDFNGDGKRDIWDDWDDIIGSVANYFHAHGWQPDALIAVPAAWQGGTPPAELLTPTTVGALRQAGVFMSAGVADDETALLVALQQQDGVDYWVGLHNFSVILQYNKSALYAMAATDLAVEISRARAAPVQHAAP
ncbi:MAG TPA: lytic murein transglycosylase B [Gammaproteobacteria bacterium]|nr:lytic murein transglycosylase B [Gammaproteobacteria bacterium]